MHVWCQLQLAKITSIQASRVFHDDLANLLDLFFYLLFSEALVFYAWSNMLIHQGTVVVNNLHSSEKWG